MTIDPNTAPTELLPCPFCGSTDIATDGPSYTLFMCNGCGGRTYDQGSHAEAIAAWNHRAPTAMQPDGLEVVAWIVISTDFNGDTNRYITEQGGFPPTSVTEPLVRHSQAATQITRLEAERDALKYGHDEVARFVRRRIPEDQNQEQAENFYAWIGMIYQLETAVTRLEADVARLTKERDKWEERFWKMDANFDRAVTRAEAAEAQNKAMREALEWYEDRAGLAGAMTEEGARARAEMTADNGARATLSTIKEGGGKPS